MIEVISSLVFALYCLWIFFNDAHGNFKTKTSILFLAAGTLAWIMIQMAAKQI